MPTLIIFLILVTSALATEETNSSSFSFESDVTGLMSSIEEGPKSQNEIFTEEDKVQIAQELAAEVASP